MTPALLATLALAVAGDRRTTNDSVAMAVVDALRARGDISGALPWDLTLGGP